MSNVIATEQAYGGGGIAPASIAALAAAYTLDPADPANWLDHAMFKPFSFTKEVVKDAGNRAEILENAAAIHGLSQQVLEALRRSKERRHFESAARSLLAARAQLANVIASAVESNTAKRLGLQTLSHAEALKYFRAHIKLTMLFEQILDVTSSERAAEKYIFHMKVPANMAVATLHEAMHARLLPSDLVDKKDTTRKERRYSQNQFRSERTKFTGDMNYPVLLDRNMIEQLNAKAVANGENLVEVVGDGRLGMSSGKMKIPQEIASRLLKYRLAPPTEAVPRMLS